MPAIEVALENKPMINAAHAEFTKARGTIETIVEGSPIFSGMVATGCTMIVSRDFANYLTQKGIPFKLAR